MTGGSVRITGETGKVSGDGILTGKEIANWENNQYFRLTVTDMDGKNSEYVIPMAVTDITGE